eukprot:5259406-Amphidinium_carterae.1
MVLTTSEFYDPEYMKDYLGDATEKYYKEELYKLMKEADSTEDEIQCPTQEIQCARMPVRHQGQQIPREQLRQDAEEINYPTHVMEEEYE